MKHRRIDFLGRIVAAAVGADLANAQIRGEGRLDYWKAGVREVDDVAPTGGGTVTAIEVKSGPDRRDVQGMAAFDKQHSPDRKLLSGGDGIPRVGFLEQPVSRWIAGPSFVVLAELGQKLAQADSRHSPQECNIPQADFRTSWGKCPKRQSLPSSHHEGAQLRRCSLLP